MSERARIEVTEEFDGVRIDRTLAVLSGLSRAQSRQLIDAGEVEVAGRKATKTTVPRSGDIVEYPVPAGDVELVPEPVAFEVALQTDDVIVVDKPAGVVVHPGAGNQRGTLAHGLAYRFPELAALGEESRWGLVHRLDRDTSGLLLVARTAQLHHHLQEQLQLRRVGRTYLAVVAGHLDAATGTIEAPIGRDPLRPTRMAIVGDGRPARTHYTRLESWDECTFVEIELETGRTHQIRVHFSSIGHGLVGDHTYGDVSIELADPGRVWLHAARLRFSLPDGSSHDVESSLPDDLEQSLIRLRNADRQRG